MKFRVFSDVHLDFDIGRTRPVELSMVWEPSVLETDSDTTLIIAGDMWHADKFMHTAEWLNKLSLRFKNIVVVLGNHDYWGTKGWASEPPLLQFAVYDNVFVLEKQTVVIDGVLIGGTTMWTSINNQNPLSMMNAASYTNDMTYISGMTAEIWSEEHSRCVEWIKQYPIDILVTHYIPTPKFTSNVYKGNSGNCMFSSKVAESMTLEQLPKIWLFGHTHTSFNEELYGTQFICNPRGYYNENSEGFDKVSLYEI